MESSVKTLDFYEINFFTIQWSVPQDSEYIGMDSCSGETGIQPSGSDEIIDPPSGVFLAGFKAVGPPGINALGIRIKVTEGIRKTGV